MAALEQQQVHAEDKKEKEKKSQGKRKIEIKLIEKMASRQVAFSKRRRGLFSKASELCVLCGAEIAIVVFSGAGKLFSFGHPTADSVIRRYLNSSSSSSSSMEGKEEITHIGITGVEKKMRSGFWWDEPIDENLGLDEFEQLKVALVGLRNRVASRLHEINFSLMGYDNFNDDNNVGFEDQQIVDFGGVGWGNFSQAACDFAWMGYPYPVHHGMDGTTLRMSSVRHESSFCSAGVLVTTS